MCIRDSVYTGAPNRVERYGQYNVMDMDSEVNGALDILAEFCTQMNTQNKTSFQIDFKTDEVVNPALDVINKTRSSERVCVASFNSSRLDRVRKSFPDLCISMGPNEVHQVYVCKCSQKNR